MEILGRITADTFRSESEVKVFDCFACVKKFASKPDLEAHLLTHSGVKAFKCLNCGNSFPRSADLIQHMVSHRGTKASHSSTCGKKPVFKLNLKVHTYTGSQSEDALDREYSSPGKDSINNSRRSSHHNVNKFLECSTCRETFISEKYLRAHVLTHRGGRYKPFVCPCLTCDARFARKWCLERHKVTHGGDKPFECSTCGKKFAFKAYLNAHMLTLTHNGVKPFDCFTCGQKFALKAELYEHMVIHSRDTGFGNSTHLTRTDRKRNAGLHFKAKLNSSDKVKSDASILSFSEETLDFTLDNDCDVNVKPDISLSGYELDVKPDICLSSYDEGQPDNSLSRSDGVQSEASLSGSDNVKPDISSICRIKKLNQCPRCCERFSSQNKLMAHLLTHSDDSVFRCEICNCRFTSKRTLTKHAKNINHHQTSILGL